MASHDPQVNAAVCAVASEVRRNGTDSPRLAKLRAELAVAKLEDYIKRVVDSAPPLAEEQRASLAALLRGGADDVA